MKNGLDDISAMNIIGDKSVTAIKLQSD